MKTPEISIIVPTYNEEGNIKKLYNEVSASLKGYSFEVIYVDDGSRDTSLEKVKQLAEKHPEVHYVTFSRNFGHQAALRAGLRHAQGAAVISMDADLQHPPKLLPTLIEQWRKGFEVVYTIRKDTKQVKLFKRLTSRLFYGIMNFLSGLKMEEGAADFRLLDRKVVDVINAENETDLFLRGYIHWLGFHQIGISYMPAVRFSGTTKYSLKKMVSFAGNGVTQFSIKPLRLSFLLATLAFGIGFLYVLYAVWAAFVQDAAVPGWLSIVVLFVFFQGIQFLLLGLVGEYLGRTFIQTKHRPEYIVSDTNCA
jgi:polyisoprenyl-phosphate glycosyltransferase